MSLYYFLMCKKMIQTNISYIDEIILNYEKMYYELTKQYECMSDCNQHEYYNNILKMRTDFINKKKENEQLLSLCKNKIYILCNHEFVDDEIEITPEKMIKITLCSICESTKQP
jgi:hypothetical protein